MDKSKIVIILNLILILILAFQIIDFNRTKSESQCVELPNGNGPVCRLTEPQSSLDSSIHGPGCPQGSYLIAFHFACGEDQCGGGTPGHDMKFAYCRYLSPAIPGAHGGNCY
ncbi:MAG: hypothetical protein JW847_00070 [Candidatus Omnitrophica bacterium]|nr:hypothetical protein [Candidatus Omnitrophota bacterium]